MRIHIKFLLNNIQYQSIVLLITGGFLLAFQDSLVKFAADWTSFWQFQTLRSFFNLLLLISLPSFFGIKLSKLLPKNILLVAFRTLFLILCMFFFFCAAPKLSIAQMATGLYTYPIFVVIFAFFFLKESLNFLKLIALLCGIIGASLVLKPWSIEFSIFQIFPIMAGFFYACNLFVLRKFCSNESPLAMTSAVAVGFILSGCLGMFFVDHIMVNPTIKESMPYIAIGWPELTIFSLFIAAFASFFNLSGNLCLVKAYQTSESSFLAPLDFLYLIFALFWGKVIFNTLPDSLGLFGIFLILISGVVVAIQANKLKKENV